MKKLFLILVLSLIGFYSSAQNVVFSDMVKVHNNTDKFLYRVAENLNRGEYLGEIEVQGFSNDDTEVFGKIYRKAKEIGANAFVLKLSENIDGSKQIFDPWHYKFKLYHIDKEEIPANKEMIYVLGSASKDTQFKVNRQKVKLPMRSYYKIIAAPGETMSLSNGKFLGSSIAVSGDNSREVQYFQAFGFNIDELGGSEGGLKLKSGDIILLERSYGDFLSAVYADMGFITAPN